MTLQANAATEAAVPITELMTLHTIRDSSTQVKYRLYVPSDYTASKKYRLVLFLHGSGERGIDGEKHLAATNGIIHKVVNDENYKHDTILLAPQCPPDVRWVDREPYSGQYTSPKYISPTLELVMDVMDKEIIEKYNVDTSKVYVSGLSMGGQGTWDLITRYPGYFAAAGAICGGLDIDKLDIIKRTPVWAANDPDDKVVAAQPVIEAVQALKDMEADVYYKAYDVGGDGHASWVPAYTGDDADDNIYNFLFSRTRNNFEVKTSTDLVLGEFTEGMRVKMPAGPKAPKDKVFSGWSDGGTKVYAAGIYYSVPARAVELTPVFRDKTADERGLSGGQIAGIAAGSAGGAALIAGAIVFAVIKKKRAVK